MDAMTSGMLLWCGMVWYGVVLVWFGFGLV
jgi:hypothetical protein